MFAFCHQPIKPIQHSSLFTFYLPFVVCRNVHPCPERNVPVELRSRRTTSYILHPIVSYLLHSPILRLTGSPFRMLIALVAYELRSPARHASLPLGSPIASGADVSPSRYPSNSVSTHTPWRSGLSLNPHVHQRSLHR